MFCLLFSSTHYKIEYSRGVAYPRPEVKDTKEL